MRCDAGPKKRGCSNSILFEGAVPACTKLRCTLVSSSSPSVHESGLAVYASETPRITSREWFGWKLYHLVRACLQVGTDSSLLTVTELLEGIAVQVVSWPLHYITLPSLALRFCLAFTLPLEFPMRI